jgi:caspase domain-containing protein
MRRLTSGFSHRSNEPVMDGKRSALILASHDYEDPGLRLLRAPARDAEALGRVLRDPEIGNFEVRTLLNQPAHVVNLAVEEFFADRKPDDLLVLHFSGHGVKDDSGELYFATVDTKLQRLGSTTVSAQFVNRQMNRSRSRRIVVLLDCCYAGAFERGMVSKADQAVHVEEQFGGRGRAVITASGAMEYAFENAELTASSELRPSVFTRAVVEGLETGDADRDQDGFVGLDELYDYVYDRVQEVTPNQTPGKWTFAIQGELFIARRRGPVTKPAALPAGLQQALDQPLGGIRLAAVQELERLLGTPNSGLALAARLTLERLREDDSRAVAAAAAAALDAHAGPASAMTETSPPKLELSTTVVDFGRLAWHAESPRRTVRLDNGGGGTLNAKAETSARWLTLLQADDELVVAVDTTVAGEREGVVNVQSDGGSAAVHVLVRVDPEPPAETAVGVPPPEPVVERTEVAGPVPRQSAAPVKTAGRGQPRQGQRPRLRLLLVVLLGLGAIAVWVDQATGPTSSRPATAVGSAQTTRAPSTTIFAVDGESLVGTTVSQEPFSNRSGWDTVDDAAHTLRYRDGAYEMAANQLGNYVALPRERGKGSSLADVMVGVDARRVTGDDPNGYGIACRYKNSQNYYWFNITNAGWYAINKMMNGNHIRLGWPKRSTGVISATRPNQIRVMCAQRSGGPVRLSLWVNGKQVAAVTDPDQPLGPGGSIGVFGHNAGKGPSKWTFDNFTVWELTT